MYLQPDFYFITFNGISADYVSLRMTHAAWKKKP